MGSHMNIHKKKPLRIKGSKDENKQRAAGKLGSFQTLGKSLKMW